MISRLETIRPILIVRAGILVFTLCIAFAYALYPHWVTLSDFASMRATMLLYVFAMLVATAEIYYLGSKLRRNPRLKFGANTLCASAIFAGLIVCVPYTGSNVQKDIHDAAALFFVLFAATGFASIANQLRNYVLAAMSGVIFALCILELLFLSRNKLNPTQPWLWTILELTGIAALVAAMYILAGVLESKSAAKT
jgi:hypothetical protein